MFGLDEWIAELGGGGGPNARGVLLALAVALLVGLRHATDPDHLTAVSTLTLAEQRTGARRAGMLGLWWGLGHGVTLLVLGLPVVLLDHYLPDPVQQGTEVAVGVVIAVLAVRLLIRWQRGYFHVHPHRHGEVVHSHPHVHVAEGESHDHGEGHDHAHADALGRTPLASFGIGLLHGAGGSAGVGILLVAAIPGQAASAIALTLFAAGTAASMALVSSAFGAVLGRAWVARRLATVAPGLGAASLLFGAWYALGALDTVPYAF